MFRKSASLLLLLGLTACGAGVVGGVLAGNRGRGPQPPAARAPSMTVDVPVAALFGQEGALRRVFLNDFVAPTAAQFEIDLIVPGLPDRRDPQAVKPDFVLSQASPTVLSTEATLTRVGFLLNVVGLVDAMQAAGRATTSADVPALLSLRVDGREIAPRAAFTFARQPTATLVPSRSGAREEFVSVTGGTRFTLRVSNARSTEAVDFSIAIATPNQTGATVFLTQEIRDVTVATIAGSSDVLVTGSAPQSAFACQVFASVRDRQSGLSTPVPEIYYRPGLDAVSPRSAAADGGTLMLLSGSGLLPLRFPVQGQPGEPDYDKITLWVEKGGRTRQVEPALIRRQPPSLNRLVFEVPPSPDARPGPAEIVLRATVGSVVVEARAGDLFVYGDASPVFGPRGTALPAHPDDVAFGRIEDRTGALDAVMCSAVGGLPRVQLFVSTDNGMLRRFGAPITAGALADPGQRRPARVRVTDLDGDGHDDVLLFNRGDGGPATHTALRGQLAPAPPLAARGGVIGGAAEAEQARRGDFDRNGMEDFVVLPPRGVAASPEVYLSFGATGTGPRFVRTVLTQIAPGFEQHEVADFDGDGIADLAFGRGGTDPQVRTLYGRGDGSFVDGQTLALATRIPGYTEDAGARLVGLHACGPASGRALALVLAGLGGSGAARTPPTVAVLGNLGGRMHAVPVAASTINYTAAAQPFGTSMAADLDDSGFVELVVANVGLSLDPTLRLYRWQDSGSTRGFAEIQSGVEPGVEPIFNVSSLAVGRAVAGSGAGARTFKTVVVTHQFVIGFLTPEEHISTLLVDVATGTPRLIAPDAAVDHPVGIRGVAIGRFGGMNGTTRALDVAVASDAGAGRVEILANDGIGGLSAARRFDVGLLAPTVATLPVAAGDAVVFLDAGRRLGVVLPGANSADDVLFQDLSDNLPAELRGVPLDETSRIAVGDVDGDGVADAVLLLVFSRATAALEARGQLLLLLGNGASGPRDLPFHLPSGVASAPAHGDARALGLANFVVEASEEAQRLEVAVAVGGAGNHVRFFRFADGGGGPPTHRVVRSFADPGLQTLIAGERPEFVAATDLDGNGVGDLAVVSTADRQINLFVNAALPSASGEVDIAAFRVVAGSVAPPGGAPTLLQHHDVNGDGIPDAIVVSESVIPQLKREVQIYLGTGTGLVTGPVSPGAIRTGDLYFDRSNAVPRQRTGHVVLAVGHLNGDDVPDMVLGWDTLEPGDRNLRVLFGGVR